MKRGVFTILARTGVHVMALMVLVNGALYAGWRYFWVSGQECMTRSQAQADERCLLIYNVDVYDPPGTSGHHGHNCGEDVSGRMQASHLADQGSYLNPFLVTQLCANAPTPTVTPMPQPSNTPIPAPTNTPVPAQPTATPTQGGGGQPNPTATPTQGAGGGTTASPTPIKRSPTPSVTSGQELDVGSRAKNPPPIPESEIVRREQPQDVGRSSLATLEGQGEVERSTLSQVPLWYAIWHGLTAVFIEGDINAIGWWIRIFALLGLWLMGVSLVVGFWRVKLFRFWGRSTTMWLHYLSGALAGMSVLAHILLVYLDKNGWGATLDLRDLALPGFGTPLKVTWSLGVFGWYLLAVVLLSGVWFKKLARILGYRAWSVLHLSSLGSILLVFWHGLRIGTDFKNGAVVGGYWILMLYVVWRLNKAVWEWFHAPKPQPAIDPLANIGADAAAAHALAGRVKKSRSAGANVMAGKGVELVDKLYYVVSKEQDQDKKGWWILLSDGVNRLYGYFAGEGLPRREWLKVQAAKLYDSRHVPYLAISRLVPA